MAHLGVTSSKSRRGKIIENHGDRNSMTWQLVECKKVTDEWFGNFKLELLAIDVPWTKQVDFAGGRWV